MMFKQAVKKNLPIEETHKATDQAINRPLRDSVLQALKTYFALLNGENIHDLYDLVLTEVEKPLFDIVMQYTQGNKSQAASIMGLNRGTLRKKLKKYGIVAK